MSIYAAITYFYLAIIGIIVTVLGCRWVKRVEAEQRAHIEEKSPARALQGEDEQPVLEAITFPKPRTGLLDPNWKYVKSEATDIRKTFREHRAQVLAQTQGENRE